MTEVPRVTVVGLGPAGPELLSAKTIEFLGRPGAILRTAVHPAAAPFAHLPTYDAAYESAEDFDSLYAGIVEDLVRRAGAGPVTYAVPGSPMVAERTVELLLADDRVAVELIPALSFCDLAWMALRIDPIAEAVTVIDLVDLLARRDLAGPLLVAQAWSDHLVAEFQVQVDWLGRSGPATVTVLHHLGLPDEVVVEVTVAELHRAVEFDHLTSLYVGTWPSPGAALAELMVLAERLRRDCPWDQEQTHASLARHLLEEAHEALEALDALDVADDPIAAAAHLEEELGDVLFQVCFHAVLGAEDGDFTVTDLANSVRTKLVARHPHVFGDVVANDAATVAANWEELKKVEKGRASVTDGIPATLPALALVAKLQKKAASVGLTQPTASDLAAACAAQASALVADGSRGDGSNVDAVVGELLDAVVALAATVDVDAEGALRRRANALRAAIVDAEGR